MEIDEMKEELMGMLKNAGEFVGKGVEQLSQLETEDLAKAGRKLGEKTVEYTKLVGQKAKQAGQYVDHYGAAEMARKVAERGMTWEDYDAQRLNEIASEEELERQRANQPCDGPMISIVVPVFNPDELGFAQMLTSVKNQTYQNWQLCIADASDIPVEVMLDERIRYIHLDDNEGISANTNAALALAEGEYVAFMDQDDVIELNALYEIALVAMKGADLIYTDEDKVNHDLSKYERPFRKPDYNDSLLLSTNYICHLTVIRRTIVDELGGLRSEYDGAQDYDMILRAVEYIREGLECNCTAGEMDAFMRERVAHVPQVLYHWRMGGASTSGNAFEKEYAYQAGRAALEAAVRSREVAGRDLNGDAPEHGMEGLRDLRVRTLRNPGYFRVVLGSAPEEGVYMTRFADLCGPDSMNAEAIPGGAYAYVYTDEMHFTKGDVNDLVKRARIADADIVVPRQVKNGKYYYNGLAKAGSGHTPSLKGQPSWYHGPYQLAMVNMDVDATPICGILIRTELLKYIIRQIGPEELPSVAMRSHINRKQEWSRKLKMVYAPEVELTL